MSEKESAARADFAEALRKIRREERSDRADEEPSSDATTNETARADPADEAQAGEKTQEREARSASEEEPKVQSPDEAKVQENGEGAEEGQTRTIRETGFVVLVGQGDGDKADQVKAEDGAERAGERANPADRPGVTQAKRAQGQTEAQTPAHESNLTANPETQPEDSKIDQHVEVKTHARADAPSEHKVASRTLDAAHQQQADANAVKTQVSEDQAAAAKDRAAKLDEANKKDDRQARAEGSRLADAKAEADRSAPVHERERVSPESKSDWTFAEAGEGAPGARREGNRTLASAKVTGNSPAAVPASQQIGQASSEAAPDVHAHSNSSGGTGEIRAVQVGGGAAGDAGADAGSFSRGSAGAEALQQGGTGVRGSTSGPSEASAAKTQVARAAPAHEGAKAGGDSGVGAHGSRAIAAVVSRSGEPALEVFSAGGQKVGGRMAQTDAQFERMLAAQVERGVMAAMNAQGNSVTIRLHPAALGQLRVQVQMEKGGGVSAKFEASSTKAKDAIAKGVGALRESLDERGIELERVAVSIAGEADPGFVESGEGGNAHGREQRSEQQANASGRRFGTRLAKGHPELSSKVDGGAVIARGRSSGEMLESLGAAASVRAHRPT